MRLGVKELGFGIIGCGVISNWHANAVLEVPGIRLAGVKDVNERARHAFGAKYSVPVFETVEDLIISPEIDVVSICTPSGLHAKLDIQAANAGKHIICEKPMAIGLEEADAVIAACEANKVKMAVISQLRFSDAVAGVYR